MVTITQDDITFKARFRSRDGRLVQVMQWYNSPKAGWCYLVYPVQEDGTLHCIGWGVDHRGRYVHSFGFDHKHDLVAPEFTECPY